MFHAILVEVRPCGMSFITTITITSPSPSPLPLLKEGQLGVVLLQDRPESQPVGIWLVVSTQIWVQNHKFW